LKKGGERRDRRPRFQRARKRQNLGRRKENADKELKRKNAKNILSLTLKERTKERGKILDD